MINLKEINFRYNKRKEVFKGINLTATQGHIYGLLGKNGAGKTTLLKIMSGLRFANEGEVNTLGYNAAYRDYNMLKNIYLLPEEMYVPSMKIKDYVKAYAQFYPDFNIDRFEDFMHQFEITNQEDMIDKLSHGQKKKVLICFALACNTQILLMDEPTNGLDIPSKSIFRKVMAMAADEDRLIIISTHQVRDLHSLIDAVIIIEDGEIILNATTEEITDKLTFKFAETEEEDKTALYSEDCIRGKMVVTENDNHSESKLDIELLFNATMINKEKIKNLFNNNNHEKK